MYSFPSFGHALGPDSVPKAAHSAQATFSCGMHGFSVPPGGPAQGQANETNHRYLAKVSVLAADLLQTIMVPRVDRAVMAQVWDQSL